MIQNQNLINIFIELMNVKNSKLFKTALLIIGTLLTVENIEILNKLKNKKVIKYFGYLS